MYKQLNVKRTIIPAAASSLVILGGCKEDEGEERADHLIGEWEVVSVDGEAISEDYDDYTYSVIFEFEADGDFNSCYEYESLVDPDQSYSYCQQIGDWEWIRVGEELQIDDNDGYEIRVEISSLTESRMEGTWEIESENEEYEIVLEKL